MSDVGFRVVRISLITSSKRSGDALLLLRLASLGLIVVNVVSQNRL
jgi:hypothetical protein